MTQETPTPDGGPSRILASLEGKRSGKSRTAAVTSALLVILIAGVSYGAWRASTPDTGGNGPVVARGDARPAEAGAAPPPAQPAPPPVQAARIIDVPPIALAEPPSASPLAALERTPDAASGDATSNAARGDVPASSPLAALADAPLARSQAAPPAKPSRAVPADKPRRTVTRNAAPAKAAPPPPDPDADLLAALLQRRNPPRPADN